MKVNNNVLIGDNSLSFGVACVTQLERFGITSIKVEKDLVSILDAVVNNLPSVIVLDTYLSSNDLYNLKARMSEIEGYSPKIIIAECYVTQQPNSIYTQLADIYISHPVDIGLLCEDIARLVIEQASKVDTSQASPVVLNEIQKPKVMDFDNLDDDMEVAVTDVILLIGIPAHVKGYQYIRTAILFCIETPNMLNSVTKVLYPEVAKKFETSASRVERAIRHAIEIAWDRGDIETLNSYFGYTVNSHRGKPTNSEFIAMLSDKLRLKYKHILNKKVN